MKPAGILLVTAPLARPRHLRFEFLAWAGKVRACRTTRMRAGPEGSGFARLGPTSAGGRPAGRGFAVRSANEIYDCPFSKLAERIASARATWRRRRREPAGTEVAGLSLDHFPGVRGGRGAANLRLLDRSAEVGRRLDLTGWAE